MSDASFSPENPTHTTCPYCGVGCGVAVSRANDTVAVAGLTTHPANAGRLCVKGSALAETVGLEGRLLQPLKRDNGVLQPQSWDVTLAEIASRFQASIAQHGAESVAFYVSGQLLTEDYYVANKLVKGYFGHAHIDTNSRLCMSSAVAGHVRAFGEDIVPVSYQDLEQTDLLVLVGSNLAWCHPILFQRVLKAKELRPEMQIVVIDPRRTATCELADLHLPIHSGKDVWLFNGLLNYLHEHGLTLPRSDLSAALKHCDFTLEQVAKATGLQASAVEAFYRLWARTPKVITAFSMGVNQSSAGTDKVSSIINVHIASGRIHHAGAGPLSITGQPNAMGGREVGGLANMLAAHLSFEQKQVVQDFWQSPHIAGKAGLKAVELFRAIDSGKIKALWVMATNPVVSLPEADFVRRALGKLDCLVVSEMNVDTDTGQLAHYQLPSLAWGEKDGTVTNTERCISRQRAFLPPPAEAKADWWQICAFAEKMGWGAAFAFDKPSQIFDEHARLTTFQQAEHPRFLNLQPWVGLSEDQYQNLAPARWGDGVWPVQKLHPVLPRAPVHGVDDEFPLVLNTGRVRDHWHTMSRTGKAPTLASHTLEPSIELHPYDALLCGVKADGLARVSSPHGSVILKVQTEGNVRRGNVFAPIHWSGRYASDARIGKLVNPEVCPTSGEPEFKHTPVKVEPYDVQWWGFVLSRREVQPDTDWWIRIQGAQFQRYELAGRLRRGETVDWPSLARGWLGADAEADWLDFYDANEGFYRAAWVEGEQLEACVFISPYPDLPERRWLASLFGQALNMEDRIGLLTGQAATPAPDMGKTICSCFGIGEKAIDAAIQAGCRTPKALGEKLKCGTNCGSCIPELKKRIAEGVVGNIEGLVGRK
jgi:assimilatory nitrate reductase catalytic subunit